MQPSTSDWISIAGLAVALFSLVVAFVQGHRAKGKAEAALRHTAGAMLLFRTNDLERVDLGIRAASDSANAEAAILEWRRIAPEYQALLKGAAVADTDLDNHLKLSLGMLDIALNELANKQVPIEMACRRLLQHTSPACALGKKAALDMMIAIGHA